MESTLKLAIFIGLVCCALADNPLKEVFSWKQVDFEFPSENARQDAIASKEFIPENNLPLGLERWKNKLFVTFPRWKEGTAATLTYLDLNNPEKSPKFKPYPDWEAHKLKGNNMSGKIVNVFRLNVDVCDRLWIQDQGVDTIIGEKGNQVKGNSIMVYDLNTDRLIKEYTIPKEVLKPPYSWIANIIVETSKENCNKAYAYVPDLGANQLIVYSFHEDQSWSMSHHFMSFDPLKGDYNIGGLNFQWNDGIFGVALSPQQADGYRTLYFHPMSTTREFAVSTKILQNKTISGRFNERFSYHEYKNLGCRGANTQSSGSSLDPKTGVLFYTLLNKNAVGCFNTFNNKPYEPSTNPIIAQDNTTMIFPNDLKVDKEGTLWVLTDRLPNFMFDKLDYNDVNFRIFNGSVEEIIKGTACDKSASSRLVAMNSLLFLVMTVLILRWR